MEYAALYIIAASSDGDGPGLGHCTYDVPDPGLSYYSKYPMDMVIIIPKVITLANSYLSSIFCSFN